MRIAALLTLPAENDLMSIAIRDLKADWRRWTAVERVTAIALVLGGSLLSAVLTVTGATP
jgi:hypothetical protein